MKSIMKRALALVIGLVISVALVEPCVAYAHPGHNHGGNFQNKYVTATKHVHVYNRAVKEKWTDATCNSFGTQVWACGKYVTKNGVKVLCDEEITVVSSAKLPHTYVSTATEESDGVYKCACGAVEYKMCYFCSSKNGFGLFHVPHPVKKVAPQLAHQHTVVTEEAVTATCTTDGLTEGSYCATCGEVFATQEVVAATGHTWDEGHVWVEATCNKSGEVEYKCINEGCDVSRTEYPTSNAHAWTTVAAVEPSCTVAGHNEYSLCETCGIYWGYEETPAVGHNVVVDEAVEATCTTTGLTEGSHCSTCGEVLVAQEEVPVKEHAWYVVREYSYCEIEGVRYYKCEAKCGANKEEVVAPLGHTYETVAAKEATCTEDGHTEYTMCTTCGKFWNYEVIPAGHKWEVIWNVIPCQLPTGQTGERISKCTVCGERLLENIASTGHTMEEREDGSHCTTCGNFFPYL